MIPPNKKKQNEHGAKAKLFKAAIRLFAKKGYASTSVREIVTRAGVTKPVLYYYFGSKQGLFHAILDWAAEQQQTILSEALEMPGTLIDRLILLNRRIYKGVMENQNLFRMIHNLVFGPPQGAPHYDLERYHRNMVTAIKAIYLEGLSRGEVKRTDPDEVAYLVLGLIDFCFHLDYVHPELSDPERPERLMQLAFLGVAQAANPRGDN